MPQREYVHALLIRVPRGFPEGSFAGCGGLWQEVTTRLAQSGDADHSYNRGLFLPICKSSGLGMNRVGANKSLAVSIKHSHLPMMVLPPTVFSE